MVKSKSHLRLAGIILLSGIAARVNAEAPKISGFLDTTYTYDFNRPASRTTALRSFDRKTDTFLLNAAQVNIEGSKDGIGYYSELAFGTDASVYKSAGTGADAGLPGAPSTVAYNFELQEAFLTYKCPMSGVMLKAGKFATTQGIEVIESKDNFTITRGLLFGLAEPYTHVGLMAGYAFPKIVDFWVGATNGWDLHTDNNYGKSVIGKIGLNFGDMASGSFSVIHGPEQANTTINARTSVDTTWFLKPTSKLTLALQANAGVEDKTNVADRNGDALADGGAGHWFGAGIQPKYSFTDKFSLGARYEWFSDLDGARTGAGATGATTVAQNLTIAPQVNMTDALAMRVEYRHDWTSRGTVFENESGLFNRGDVNTVGLEFIYKF